MLDDASTPAQLSRPLSDSRERTRETVAVLKETTAGETRVAITPPVVRTLMTNGFHVVVEADAIAAAGFSNADYVRVGATVVETKRALLQNASIIAWVKPRADVESALSHASKGATVIGFMNPFGKKSVLPRLEKWGLLPFALELLPLRHAISPTMDALAAMSRFAGRIAVEKAIALREEYGGKRRHTVLVIGAGHAGMAAARSAAKAGCNVVCASPRELRRAEIENDLQGTFVKLHDQRPNVEPEVTLAHQRRELREAIPTHNPSIIVTTARRGAESPPKLLLANDLELLDENSIIIDLTMAAGGNVETCIMDKSVRGPNGVWVCHRSNYPSAEPSNASSAYASCLAEVLRSGIFKAKS